MEESDAKSRTELIKMAQDILEQKHPELHFDFKEFDRRVWNGSYGITKVIFRRSIRYISNASARSQYDITVNLNTREITPLDMENEEAGLYRLSEKGENVIADLKKKGLLPDQMESDIEYSITENNEYSLISCFNDLPTIDKRFMSHEGAHPFLQKSLVNKKTGRSLLFKGANPFYFSTQLTFEHYYNKDLYIVLDEVNQTSDDKAEIIKIASSILESKKNNLKIDPKDFEIIFLGNYKDIIVKYRRYIRLKNGNEKRAFDLAVNIITKEVFPFDSSDDASFHLPSEEDNTIISAIQQKLPLSLSPKTEHTVSENEDSFWITSISEKLVKKYCIHKNTHEIFCFNESFNLPVVNHEDISLQEQYARMNGFFPIQTDHDKTFIDKALTILKENKFIPGIIPEDYMIKSEASKDEVRVKFKRWIKFIPLRHNGASDYQYDLEVHLVSKTIAQDAAQFYLPSEEDSKTIKLVKTQLTRHLKYAGGINYPIEITEEADCFIVRTSDAHNFDEGSVKHYRMDKKSATIEVVSSFSNFFPTPAPYPGAFDEIKD